MFELYYRVVHSEYDDFVGQNGFFQIKCNECKYGEIYPKELETVMDKVSLYDWFERLARVIKYLSFKDYVALSDVELFNTWIEFRKTNEEVMVSIVKAEKEEGSHDIEFNLKEPIAGEWEKQMITYQEQEIEMEQKSLNLKQQALTNNYELERLKKSIALDREEYQMGVKSKAQLLVAEDEYNYKQNIVVL